MREQSHIHVTPNAIVDVLSATWDNISEDDVAARCEFLRQFVSHIEMGNEEGKVYYTFPLELIDPDLTLLIKVPPRGFIYKECQIDTSIWATPAP